MKVVILAGGLGSRLSEETIIKPKPMVEIGDKPILWHIMKIYSSFGFNDFVILLGYKGFYIKDFFLNYYLHRNDLTVNLSTNNVSIHRNNAEPWNVTLVETGDNTLTGSRIKQAAGYTGKEPFFLTYGDGVSDVNIDSLLQSHKKSGKLLTVTAVQPDGRFGVLDINSNGEVSNFNEKPSGEGGWINGGFFVCEPELYDFIPDGEFSIFEREPVEAIAKANQLHAYKHSGFWKCMDTLRDKTDLNELWISKKAKWKIWK
jgi:glucose-1-phosphate cytidylyltransferase